MAEPRSEGAGGAGGSAAFSSLVSSDTAALSPALAPPEPRATPRTSTTRTGDSDGPAPGQRAAPWGGGGADAAAEPPPPPQPPRRISQPRTVHTGGLCKVPGCEPDPKEWTKCAFFGAQPRAPP